MSSTSDAAVLFADVSGSAGLLEKLGAAEASRAVDRCLTRIERAIEGFGGQTLKKAGDEMMIVFENTEDAMQSAIEMQQRVADLPPVSGIKLGVRIGFEYGSITREGDIISGDTVRQAARLAGLACSGQILTSQASAAMLDPALQEFTRAAPATGKSKSEKSVEVIWEGARVQTNLRPAVASTPQKEASVYGRLCVRYRGDVLTVDSRKSLLSMGRDAKSDLTIHDRRASRHHASILFRNSQFVLLDRSTNGTYVSIDEGPEQFIKGREIILYGRGVICFAASADSPDADVALFEML